MKKLLVLTWMMFALLTVMGAPITPEQARQKAAKFLSAKGKTIRRTPARVSKMIANQADASSFYVFNAQNDDGFVIISGDDATDEVLGFADQGTFQEEALPVNFVDWLKQLDAQMTMIRLGKVKAAPWKNIEAHADVAQLLTTKWNQGAPYNNECPLDEGQRSVTGCVATAIAQVMNYHQWPKNATGTLSEYTTSKKSIYVPALPSTTFDWDKMIDDYSKGYTADQASAVAKLMRYCGQASLMDYTNNESYASYSNAVPVLINAMGYDKDMRHIFADSYEMEEWERKVYQELTTNGPVVYAGNSGVSGHAFVVDGYRGSDRMYHVNWGWGGYCDGFYKLFVMNPSNTGIGGGNSTAGYRLYQEMICGFKPENGVDESALLQVKPCLYASNEKIAVTQQNGKRAVTFYMTNKSEMTKNYDIALVEINKDQTLTILSQGNGEFVSGGSYWYYWTLDDWLHDSFQGNTLKFSFASKLPDGKEWFLFADDDTYIEASVSVDGVVEYRVNKSKEAPVDIVVSDLAYVGSKKQFDQQLLTFTVGQCPHDFRGYLYLFAGNETSGYTCINQVYVALMAGDEQQLSIDFVPTLVGDTQLKLTTDSQGENTVATYNVTIAEGTQENNFYLIGDINNWSTTDKSYPFVLTEDSVTWRIMFSVPKQRDMFLKVAPASAYDNQESFWSRLWCVENNGSTESKGKLVVGDKGAIKITGSNEDRQYVMRIVPSQMTYEMEEVDPTGIRSMDMYHGSVATIYALSGHKIKEVKASELNAALQQMPNGIYIVRNDNKCIIIRNR